MQGTAVDKRVESMLAQVASNLGTLTLLVVGLSALSMLSMGRQLGETGVSPALLSYRLNWRIL